MATTHPEARTLTRSRGRLRVGRIVRLEGSPVDPVEGVLARVEHVGAPGPQQDLLVRLADGSRLRELAATEAAWVSEGYVSADERDHQLA